MNIHKLRDWALTAATTVLAVCAMIAVSFRVREALRPNPMAPTAISDPEYYWTSGHRSGPDSALVRIVEFADYQCPYCQQVDPVLLALRDRYPKQVSITYRHFPLASHDSAVAAARAAECAAQVGEFDRFHHFLFANAKVIGQQSWEWFAQGAGLADPKALAACTQRAGAFPAIEADMVAGERLGIVATPTFLVNNVRFSGYFPFEKFDKIVQQAIEDAESANQ